MRKAFTLAFNRTSFLHDVVQNFAFPGSQIVPAGMFGYDPSMPLTPYDPATAKQLLLDAGAHPLTPDNAFSKSHQETVTLTYNMGNMYRETAAVVLASEINSFAADTGLYAQVVGLEWTEYLHAQRTRQLYVSFPGWSVDYVDPDDFLVPLARSSGTLAHRVSYNNPAVDKLVDEQASISDPTQRLQIIKQIENTVNNDYVYCWIDYGASWSLVRSWVHQRADAAVASGVEAANPAIAGYYYYELQKGNPTVSGAIRPSPLSIIQTATVSSLTTKKIF
jgi:peptide/nickel transport system substrate-binding protein